MLLPCREGATTPQGLEGVNRLRRQYPKLRTSRPAAETSLPQQLARADLVDPETGTPRYQPETVTSQNGALPIYASEEQRENRLLQVGEESYSGEGVHRPG